MAGKIWLPNARQVETLNRPGRHADGGNLFLSISENGGKRSGGRVRTSTYEVLLHLNPPSF